MTNGGLSARNSHALLSALLVLSMAGCALHDTDSATDPNQAGALNGLPPTFDTFTQTDVTPTQDLTTLDADQLARTLGSWWEIFDDKTLDALVLRAIEANWRLRAALENIEQARSQIVRVNASALPSLNAGVTASRQQTGTTSKLGFGLYDLYGFNASLAWEPDVFGQVQARVDTASRDAQALAFDRRALMVSITAELVDAYAQLRAVQQQLSLTRQYAGLLEQQIRLTGRLADSGLVAPAQVAQTRQAYLTTQAQIPVLQARIESLITTCSILTGGFPADLSKTLRKPAPMLSVHHPVPETLPSQVLMQRPDIAAQQARILASAAGVQAAEADFMPSFSIPLGTGYSTTPFDLLLNPASFIWSLGAGLTAPLYTGEELQASLAIAQSVNREDQLLYEQTVRQALKEVEDAVTDYQMSQQSLSSTQGMAQAQAATVVQQKSLFTTGQASRLQLNQALLDQLLVSQSVIDARYASTASLVMLYRALGGGWHTELDRSPTPPITTESSDGHLIDNPVRTGPLERSQAS